VLTLLDKIYVDRGMFSRGEVASSVLLQDFEPDVLTILDASPINR